MPAGELHKRYTNRPHDLSLSAVYIHWMGYEEDLNLPIVMGRGAFSKSRE